ncbi:MAG: SpoIIE family protein phosphatase [Leptospiraceae bacterium]|nr:SpoIIE family protein phosphatase [Leptospiraceae bacterium]
MRSFGPPGIDGKSSRAAYVVAASNSFFYVVFLGLFALFLISSTAGAGELMARGITLEPGFKSVEMRSQLEQFLDSSGKMEIEDVLSSGPFQPAAESVLSTGLTRGNQWLRFSVTNNTGMADPVYLEIYYPLLDYVSLFRLNPDGSYSRSDTGDMLPFSSREVEHRNFIFPLRIPEGSTSEFLLCISSRGPLQVPARIRSAEEMLQRDRITQFVQGLYFGIMLAMILYNLFLYVSVRYAGYLYYVFYILGLSIFQLIYHGYFFATFFPSWPIFVNESIVLAIAFMLFWGIQFSRKFLNTGRYDRALDIPLLLLQVAAVVGGALTFFIPYTMALNLSVLSSVLFVFVIYVAALRRLYRGYRPARFFLLAWTTLLFAILVLALKQYGLIEYNFFTNYALQIGSAMEVILLSVALGDRIKSIEMEKKKAQAFAYESLKKAHRIKDEFLYNTSQELREPLEGIVGMAEGLLDLASRSSDRPGRMYEIHDGLSVLAATGSIVSGLVNDILDFYRIKNSEIYLNRTTISAASVASVALDLCGPWAEARGIELKMEIREDIYPVYADEVRLRQILLNLLNNGIKFTQAGHVAIRARNVDQFVEFTIEDTGSGIAADALEDIFFIFEKPELAAGRKNGKGLGLTITRKLIELHGGVIRAESSEQGARLIFTLPRSQVPGVILASPEAPSSLLAAGSTEFPAEESGEGPVILLADGDTIHLKAQQRRLLQAGFRVLAAGNYRALIEHLESGRVDLLIVDLYLSGKNGYEICREVRQRFSLHELPVIIVGRGRSKAELETAMNSGANDFISRPVDRTELLSRVQMLLELRDSILERERLLSIEKELDVARSIMERLLPEELTLPSGFSGSVLYLPAGTIGGDIYDFHNNHCFNLLIADVTGHGVPAALYASMVKIAHSVAVGQENRSPAQILASIHDTIRNHLGEHFVTAGYLSIDPQRRKLKYSRAGHLPLLVLRRSENRILELNPSGRLLGLVDDLHLEVEELALESGDRILAFTDGIFETVTEESVHLGDRELKELILATAALGQDLAIDHIVRRLSELSELPNQVEDDRTMILIDVD